MTRLEQATVINIKFNEGSYGILYKRKRAK